MGYRLRLLFLIFTALFFSLSADAQIKVPILIGHVTDTVGLLSPSTRANLEAQLKSFEATKGSQVTVLVVGTTEGEAIEQFSIRVAEAWKIGRTKIDDGVILVVASREKKLRIEVGYGLEGVLPDATCKQIIENIILPQFRSGNFDGGLQDGVSAILKKLSGEQLPAPKLQSNPGNWIFYIILGLWICVLIYQVIFPGSGRFYTAGRSSGSWGSSGGGWSSGGGGGGFSGGGGSFGGGGASGSW